MMNALKKMYDAEADMIARYNTASEEEKDSIRKEHNEWAEQFDSMGADFCFMYNLYRESRDRDNEHIDICERHQYANVPEMIEKLRAYGVEHFTFSSKMSSAVEVAWEFTQNGCKLEGICQINGVEDVFNGGRKKIPAYMFSINQ